MKVLVGCECSGMVRQALRALGHQAWSCDLKPSEDGGAHIQGDVLEVLDWGWDAGIFHPVCRYLANSGAKHLYLGGKKENGPDLERWRLMRESAEFFRRLWSAPIPKVAVENPIMHRHAAELIGIRPSQVIQPWQHGHGETKATCLYLRGLPLLVPSEIVPGREGRVWRMAPSKTREADRSRTLPGIARAMAEQWGRDPDQMDLPLTAA